MQTCIPVKNDAWNSNTFVECLQNDDHCDSEFHNF